MPELVFDLVDSDWSFALDDDLIPETLEFSVVDGATTRVFRGASLTLGSVVHEVPTQGWNECSESGTVPCDCSDLPIITS